jgi:hypothetical protein
MHMGLSPVNKTLTKPLANGARMDTICGNLQHAARNHMEDLVSTREKHEGGNIMDLLIRACFLQDLYDERIKTMVKAKGNVNFPMAQLVEIALEEESTIRSDKLKKERLEFSGLRQYQSEEMSKSFQPSVTDVTQRDT